MPDAPILWTPPAERVAASRFRAFERLIGRPAPGAPTEDTYEGVRRWALDHPGEFWAAVWRFTGVISDERPGREPWDAVVTGWDRMQPPGSDGPAWFTGARLNYAENLLRAPDDRVAIVTYGSLAEARKWVSTPEESSHVTGDAVDIGPTDAADWMSWFGNEYGLCQTYANEIWHYELTIEPGGTCPPPISDAAAADAAGDGST